MKTLLIPIGFKPAGGEGVMVFWGKMGQPCGIKEQVWQEGLERYFLGGRRRRNERGEADMIFLL
jgi:hypothetical protein